MDYGLTSGHGLLRMAEVQAASRPQKAQGVDGSQLAVSRSAEDLGTLVVLCTKSATAVLCSVRPDDEIT
jgi:hypothetical protein